MSTDDPILEAARAIRPYLAELVPDEAEALDRELAALLRAAADDPGAVELVARRLEAPPAVLDWTAKFVEGGEPPDVQESRRASERYAGLPGHGDPPPVPRKYVCAQGDYTFYRRGSAPVPRCPTDGSELVSAGGQT